MSFFSHSGLAAYSDLQVIGIDEEFHPQVLIDSRFAFGLRKPSHRVDVIRFDAIEVILGLRVLHSENCVGVGLTMNMRDAPIVANDGDVLAPPAPSARPLDFFAAERRSTPARLKRRGQPSTFQCVNHQCVRIHQAYAARAQIFFYANSRADSYQLPLPDRDTFCVPDAVLSEIVRFALNELFETGLNVTVIVQCEPAVSEVPQLFVCEKSAIFEPVIAILEIFSEVVPEFVSVTGFVVALFTFSVPKLMLDGLTDAPGFITAAVIGTICGLPDAFRRPRDLPRESW